MKLATDRTNRLDNVLVLLAPSMGHIDAKDVHACGDERSQLVLLLAGRTNRRNNFGAWFLDGRFHDRNAAVTLTLPSSPV